MPRRPWGLLSESAEPYYKVLEKGRFPWPERGDGALRLTSAQLAFLTALIAALQAENAKISATLRAY